MAGRWAENDSRPLRRNATLIHSPVLSFAKVAVGRIEGVFGETGMRGIGLD